MAELESVLNEYLSSGLSEKKLIEFLRREIAKSKISPDIGRYIISFVPPELPEYIRDAEDVESIEDPVERTRVAKAYLYYNPDVGTLEFFLRTQILPASYLIPFILNDKIKVDKYQASDIWLFLILNKEFSWAEKLYKKFPDIKIEEYMINENDLKDLQDEDIITNLSKHPSVFSDTIDQWKGLPYESRYYEENKEFIDMLESYGVEIPFAKTTTVEEEPISDIEELIYL